ncbi:hypothetical protein PtA15_12A16 [Puccinia triticina]|uniref:Uncharacterized protein n=1 Tax=Puccinia triticina TaxID=208348 RepID=A0ABY7CXU3_9BASI|nr:uncharacterized protein PtA15_12A16 [Puccinia triticina]WAQ90031.1 hypothetical protein PtA15_12A16 [Puccinia triticina]
MKVQLSQSQILLEARALEEQQEEIFAQLETNRRRRRRRSEVNLPNPLRGPQGTDENVLLPGHAHPAHVKSADIHSDLQSNVSLRGNQTFFEDINEDPSKGEAKQTKLAPPKQQGNNEQSDSKLNSLEVDISRAHLIGHEIHGQHPPKSLVTSNEPAASDLSSQPGPNNSSQPSGDTGCRAKKRREQQQARANFRAYESNQTAVIASESGQGNHLGSSSSIAANSTHLAPSVPHFTHEERQEGLSKAAWAGISLAIIFLASIAISIAIIRRRRRQRKRKLSAMFDKGTAGGPSALSFSVPSAPDLHHDHRDISHKEIDELMNRVASVQAPPPARRSKKF